MFLLSQMLHRSTKMLLILLISLFATSFCATILDPDSCTEFPCLIFDEEFDSFDHNVWKHEITLGGGGNWEFQAYMNNRSITYVRDSALFIKPALTSDWRNEEFLTSGTFSLWGSQGRNEQCTGPWFYGCERIGSATNIVNPVLSGRLSTIGTFSVRYGRIEVRAKLPSGDWLWPAIWMMPENFPYGGWPASGEIDIMEGRGNDDYSTLGNEYAASTLHWGPYFELNRYFLTSHEYQNQNSSSFAENFHTWRLDWNDLALSFYLDDMLQYQVDPGTNFWDYGGFDQFDIDNIWETGAKMTPFDQPFYILLNLAVGGTNGYFPDIEGIHKPWLNTDTTAPLNFWNDMNTWLPTWQHGEGKISEKAAMQVDYVKVYKLENSEM